MFVQFFISAGVTSLTLMVAGGLATLVMEISDRTRIWLMRRPHGPKLAIVLMAALFAILVANVFSVIAWATVFLVVDAFQDTETAIYFSLVTVTTLGFGDILMPEDWRLLSGFAASNGLLLFGVYTAFIVEILRRIRNIQSVMHYEHQAHDTTQRPPAPPSSR
ncbi:MAG: potassium channel family protein [Pseudomonadota bacterium]